MKRARIILLCILLLTGLCVPVDVFSAQQGKPAAGRAIPEASLRKLFKDYVCDHLGKDPEDAILSRFNVSGNRPVPAGRREYRVFQKSKGAPKGHVRLTVIVSVNGISRSEVALSGWVDAFGPVVCTTRSMQRGEIIRESDVYLARKNLSRLPTNTLTDPDKAMGLVLKNNVGGNTCLKEWMLKRNPTVDRGKRVTILAGMGGLRVSVPGRTMEKGFVGDFIKVENVMSKKKIFARVVDSATVMVEF
jgi:flagella basal body P-ring formation protein FlgA